MELHQNTSLGRERGWGVLGYSFVALHTARGHSKAMLRVLACIREPGSSPVSGQTQPPIYFHGNYNRYKDCNNTI